MLVTSLRSSTRGRSEANGLSESHQHNERVINIKNFHHHNVQYRPLNSSFSLLERLLFFRNHTFSNICRAIQFLSKGSNSYV